MLLLHVAEGCPVYSHTLGYYAVHYLVSTDSRFVVLQAAGNPGVNTGESYID